MMLYSNSSKPKKKVDICVMDNMCRSKKNEKIWLPKQLVAINSVIW